MRTSLLQLLKWVDGAPYVMRDRWVPLDFFACDAVLLQLPPSSLWHYASHTYGWEHVSTILRTRHIVSISLTFQAYNRAAIAIKQRHCVDGFNQNQRLLLTEGVAAAAVPSTLPVFGDPPIKKNEEDEDGLEFVFVSSCSNADQWQADMLVESFERVHQRGSITRIITGCSTPALLNQVYRRTTPTTKLHFTPDSIAFQTEALRHWLQHSNAPHLARQLVVLALDFVFLSRFAISTATPVLSAYPKPDEDPDPDAMEVVHGSLQPKKVFFYSGNPLTAPKVIEAKAGVVIAQNFNAYLNDLTSADRIAALCATCPKTSEDWHFALAKKEVNSFTVEYVLANPCNHELVTPPNAAPFLRQLRRFHVATWIADPKLMPDNIFACDMWLLQEPPATLWTDAIKSEVLLPIVL
ncbi:hypothetical protein DYB36_005402 [Aphanomyces astaci]|uniref:Uncharacterized protein n=2 Tax=Aphanomyces astaci TaxID=112090 RepID=A0A397A3R3_APHAT|nr:hypothetical protein DYB36_005402 [Aphanomyces astaci]